GAPTRRRCAAGAPLRGTPPLGRPHLPSPAPRPAATAARPRPPQPVLHAPPANPDPAVPGVVPLAEPLRRGLGRAGPVGLAAGAEAGAGADRGALAAAGPVHRPLRAGLPQVQDPPARRPGAARGRRPR